MPITLKRNAINVKDDGGYNPSDTFLVGDINNSVRQWLNEHPEASVPDESLTYKKLVLGTLGFVTPEMYGAYGDGENNDTAAFQSALDSGIPVVAVNSYLVSSVNVKDTSLTIYGEITGKVIINNNATVCGGKINQSTTDPCVVFESAISGQGYMNSSLQDCSLKPNGQGVGIQIYSDANPLFGFYINNIDITSCDKSIYIYNNKWITKCAIENVFCHSPNYAILIDNLKSSASYCGDIVIKNVYAQYYNNKPLNFFKLNSGNCMVVFYDSFCYDGIEEYEYNLTGNTGDTRITIQGMLRDDPSSVKFTNASDISAFNFNTQYSTDSLLLKPSLIEELPKSRNGDLYFENFNSPALSSSRFFGFIGRGGTLQGASEPNKVFGVSCYDGRLSVLRSTNGTVASGNVVEVATPYSGNVYTTSTLPTSVRDGAKCWCSDIKMDVTYYSGTWYKPDGTALS